MTYEESTLHTTSDGIRYPACPIRSRSNGDTNDEEHTSRDLYAHRPETECADQSRLIGLVDLRCVLEDSEECTG